MKNCTKEFKRSILIIQLSVLVYSLMVLLGWHFELEALRMPLSPAMNPLTAINFILLSLCMLLVVYRKKLLFNILVGLLGIELLVYFLGAFKVLTFQVDLLLFHDELISAGSLGLKRMALNTALSFLLSGALLLLHYNKKPKTYVSQIIAFAVLSQTFFFIFGYLHKAPEFLSILEFFPMAINTTICFFLFSLSFLAYTYDSGFMTVISAPYMGGVSIRRILPVFIVIVFILSYVITDLSEAEHWSVEISVALFSTVFIVLSIVFLFTTGAKLNGKDYLNKQYEDQINRLSRRMAASINSFENLYIINVDENMMITEMNRNILDFIPDRIESGALIKEAFKNISFGDKIITCVEQCLEKEGKFDFNIQSELNHHFYNVSCRSIHTDSDIIGVAIAFNDVTELMQVQHSLAQSNAELEKFSYSIAHDLRSPLGVIRGYSQILSCLIQ
ncbi:nitrogen regulation protein NR(II) [Fulvivirga sediminis]|uniref:histidine kinase n=1 Tax=Fulvivirga sediminis TaxID=2803949 RepID=A0A937K156_9BACT|nr:hypothetical protein [Fulvivirga sediminis]MBL3657101.1 hypothetical protein [Fulvivirga sediminis]